MTETHELRGAIVRRRSLGKFLAFADVLKEDSDEIIQVAFRRTSPSWNGDDSFPITASALPYRATVRMTLLGNGEVHSWEVLEHPRRKAQQIATQTGGGVMYATYLRERGNDFQSVHRQFPPSRTERSRVDRVTSLSVSKRIEEIDACHGDHKAKGLRAKIFAAWIIETFGLEHLSKHGVLDIAGGKGQLSVELAVMGNIRCTLIDPLLRKRHFPKKELKRIDKVKAPLPDHLSKAFDRLDFVQKEHDRIQQSCCLIGLHPDECTEDILQVALKYNKSVAIVPCCVFPSFFPCRQLKNGSAVVTHSEFCQYLLEKDSRLRQDTLRFEGRNEVIYFDSMLTK